MAITIEKELQPVRIPNYILEYAKPGKRQDGMQERGKHRVEDLPRETIELICARFRKDMLEKAGYEAE